MFRQLLLVALCCCLPVIGRAAQLAIIIDDIGYSAALGRRAADLEGEVTLAVLPFTPHSIELAERAYARGKELILHAPMSNDHGQAIEQGALLSGMSYEDFQRTLNEMLVQVPHISGLNNHMGSRLTRERQPMDWLMQELARRRLYFVDSRTTAKTLALQTAQQYRIPSARRDVFLDNQRDTDHIRAQLRKALVLARAQGQAIAIGHPYPETLSVLEQIRPLLAEYQVELVKVSVLIANASGTLARPSHTPREDYCPAPPVLLWRPVTPASAAATHTSQAAHWDLVISHRK